jgi:hypothetical protein
MRGSVGASLWILVVWGCLCAAWNAYGAMQIANGQPALGPTATYAGAGLALSLAVLFFVTAGRWPIVYKILAGLGAAVAAMTVWNAFVLDPSNWPSEFWRWAGVLLNLGGVLGAALAIFGGGGRSGDAA